MKKIFKQMFAAHKTKLLLLSVLGVTACGTISVGVETTVNSFDSFSHKVTMTATGAFGEGLLDPEEGIDEESLRSLGWNVATERAGSDVTLKLNGTFEGEEAITFLETKKTEDSLVAGNFKISHENEGKYTTYRISLDIRDAVDTGELADIEEDEDDEEIELIDEEVAAEMEALLVGMFTVDWTLNFPGELVESNSDTAQDNKATWHLNLKTMEEKGEMYLITRVNNKTGGCN